MAYITISRSALFNNLDIIAQRLEDIDKIALVLKDNAYGHGLVTIATLAAEYGVRRAVVRTHEEAMQIVSFFDYILVLADTPNITDEPDPRICYTINTLEQVREIPQGTRVELKVDTGMHRNGIEVTALREAFEAIRSADLRLEALFTHYRSADTLSSEWFWQKKRFEQVKEEAAALAEEFGFAPLRFHSANSAALFRETRHDETMVRIGIAAYGCLRMDRTLDGQGLRPVLALWGEKIASRTLQAGERVGYNGTYTAAEEEVASTYDVGYADGILRAASGQFVTPGGAKLIGRVSMDNTSFLSRYSSLLLFDDANMMAEAADTIAYEILVGLRSTLPRQVID